MYVPFISRHAPTAEQSALLGKIFPGAELEGDQTDLIYEPGRVAEALAKLIGRGQRIENEDGGSARYVGFPVVVAGVFTTWAALELLGAGYTLLEFKNRPSARTGRGFELFGAVVMTPTVYRYLDAYDPHDGPAYPAAPRVTPYTV